MLNGPFRRFSARAADRQLRSLAAVLDRSGTGHVSKSDFVRAVSRAPWAWRLASPPPLLEVVEAEEALVAAEGADVVVLGDGVLEVTVLAAAGLTMDDDRILTGSACHPVVKLSHCEAVVKLCGRERLADKTVANHPLCTKKGPVGHSPRWDHTPEEQLEWPENPNTFRFNVQDNRGEKNKDEKSASLFFHVWDHHTIGRERYLGQASLDLSHHIWWTKSGRLGAPAGSLAPDQQPAEGLAITLQLQRFHDPYFVAAHKGPLAPLAHHSPRVQNHSGLPTGTLTVRVRRLEHGDSPRPLAVARLEGDSNIVP